MYLHITSKLIIFIIALLNVINEGIKFSCPESKVHGANMGPIWGRQDPGGPQVGPMNFVMLGGMEQKSEPSTLEIFPVALFSFAGVCLVIFWNLTCHVDDNSCYNHLKIPYKSLLCKAITYVNKNNRVVADVICDQSAPIVNFREYFGSEHATFMTIYAITILKYRMSLWCKVIAYFKNFKRFVAPKLDYIGRIKCLTNYAERLVPRPQGYLFSVACFKTM